MYLDNVLPTLLLRTLSRRVAEEDAIINPVVLSLLIERIEGGLCGGDTGAGTFGDRLVPANFSLWCEIFSSRELDVLSRTDKGEGDGKGEGSRGKEDWIYPPPLPPHHRLKRSNLFQILLNFTILMTYALMPNNQKELRPKIP